jgi:hypothetical protein
VPESFEHEDSDDRDRDDERRHGGTFVLPTRWRDKENRSRAPFDRD